VCRPASQLMSSPTRNNAANNSGQQRENGKAAVLPASRCNITPASSAKLVDVIDESPLSLASRQIELMCCAGSKNKNLQNYAMCLNTGLARSLKKPFFVLQD
jgi:hypothetical protein